MKIAINLSTSRFVVRSTFEVKKPLQKKEKPGEAEATTEHFSIHH